MGKQKSGVETAARGAPGAYATGARMMGTSPSTGVGILSILSGMYGMYEAGGNMREEGIGLGNSWDMAKGMGGVSSGAAGVTGTAGLALGAEGGLGAALSASAFGTVGCVAGAGLAGMAVGSIINSITDSEASADSGWFDDDETMEHRSYSDWMTDQALAADSWIDSGIGGEEGSFRDGFGDVLGGVVGGGATVAGHLTGAVPGLAASAWGAMFD